jgi:hypothetical protein
MGGLMPAIERFPLPDSPWRRDSDRQSRQTARTLAAIEHGTLVRLAKVQGEEVIQGQKLHSIDYLTREAMSGQALLGKWRDTLATGDPFVGDELRFFSDLARMGKGEVIADTISAYCREGRP